MQTALDSRHELELQALKYDGHELVVEVCELVVGNGGRVSPGAVSYTVSFPRPVAHALTEEFPAILGNWLQGADTGFLRRIENASLRTAMGLELEQFDNQAAYALVTAHEVLVVFCNGEPSIAVQNG